MPSWAARAATPGAVDDDVGPDVKALDSFAQCGDTSGTLVSQGEWQTEGVLLGGQAHE